MAAAAAAPGVSLDVCPGQWAGLRGNGVLGVVAVTVVLVVNTEMKFTILKVSMKFTSEIYVIQVTTSLAVTVSAETTALAYQTPLTTQYYLLLAESP